MQIFAKQCSDDLADLLGNPEFCKGHRFSLKYWLKRTNLAQQMEGNTLYPFLLAAAISVFILIGVSAVIAFWNYPKITQRQGYTNSTINNQSNANANVRLKITFGYLPNEYYLEKTDYSNGAYFDKYSNRSSSFIVTYREDGELVKPKQDFGKLVATGVIDDKHISIYGDVPIKEAQEILSKAIIIK